MAPPRDRSVHARALRALAALPADEQLRATTSRLGGGAGGPLDAFTPGDEREPDPGRIDGRLLEAICTRALDGARGAVFTAAPEATALAALGLAFAAAQRDGALDPGDAVAALLAGREAPPLARALDGLRVLDPACGGGALLAAAARLAAGVGARLALSGLDVSPLAASAASARLRLLGAPADVACADALAAPWPAADLLLGNPPFVRHERLDAALKERAARATGLPRQADLSAHLALLALRHAPVVALVLPRALEVSRSAAPLREEARARGGFAVRLRSRVSGSFAASVDTALAVWVAGHAGRAAAESSVAIGALRAGELAALARGGRTPRVRRVAEGPRPRSGASRVDRVAEVRFGMKSGANGFFHLEPLGGGRYRSALAGEVALADSDVAPLLASLKEARAPARAATARVLFRPGADSAAARAYVARGEALGVHLRPSCAGRTPWWRVAGGRGPAPVLYPAKIGARAFAFLNAGGACEDKKWIALFPREVEPALLAAALGATPIRLAIDLAARQLTGAQAIADVDCNVLARAPFPQARALEAVRAEVEAAWVALAEDPVTTDLAAMLARPAQRALDLAVGSALGLDAAAVEASRRALRAHVEARLARGEQVRAAVARARR